MEETAIWSICRWALPEAGITLTVSAILGIMIGWAIVSVCIFVIVTNILAKQRPTGRPTMVGMKGKTSGVLKPEGMVLIKGELWQAEAEGYEIEDSVRIEVVSENGMKLKVRRIN